MRRSGTDAIFGVAQAIQSLGGQMLESASTSQIAPSPVRRANAVKQVFEEMDMSGDEAVQISKMLRVNTDIANMYSAIPNKAHRISYIRSELEDFIASRSL